MLILPKPAKDEFALGYIGRLCHINLKQSKFEMMRVVVEHLNLKSQPGVYLGALANLSDMDVDTFLRFHTLQHVTLPYSNINESKKWRGVIRPIQTYETRTAKNNPLRIGEMAYFCPNCVDQQRRIFGFPYWSRVHQLPGVFWCPWHRKELLFNAGIDMTRRLPSTDTALGFAPLGYSKEFELVILHRYNKIMMRFLEHPERRFFQNVNGLLCENALAMGLNVEPKLSAGRFLSDVVFESCPQWWIETQFLASQKRPGRYFGAIDHVFKVGQVWSLVPYALALAILVDSDRWKALGLVD